MTDTHVCQRCGQTHMRCSGHRQDGQPCGQPAMLGQRVCRKHGGKAPQAMAAAKARMAQEEARRLAQTLGEPVETDPVEALHNLIRWSAGHVNWYRSQLVQFLPDALVWGDVEVKQSDLQGLTVVQRSQVNAWLVLYNEERKFLATICAKAIHAGLAEREVRLEEQQGALIAEIMRAVLADLELTPDQQTKALQVVPMHLRRAASLN
jgi:hypothetical protein